MLSPPLAPPQVAGEDSSAPGVGFKSFKSGLAVDLDSPGGERICGRRLCSVSRRGLVSLPRRMLAYSAEAGVRVRACACVRVCVCVLCMRAHVCWWVEGALLLLRCEVVRGSDKWGA